MVIHLYPDDSVHPEIGVPIMIINSSAKVIDLLGDKFQGRKIPYNDACIKDMDYYVNAELALAAEALEAYKDHPVIKSGCFKSFSDPSHDSVKILKLRIAQHSLIL